MKSFWKSFKNSPRKFLVVQPRCHPDSILRSKLEEALRLIEALGDSRGPKKNGVKSNTIHANMNNELCSWVVVQQQRNIFRQMKNRVTPAAFFGKGTVENINAHLLAADSHGKKFDAVFVNASLSGVQQRNLQEAWGKQVMDRVGLIIEIFGSHAHSRAAKLQVELAALEYQKSRLVRSGARSTFGTGGDTQVVSARGRASSGGGVGTRGFLSGAGEAEIQIQRTRITARQVRLKRQLADVERTRGLHRLARKRRGGEWTGGSPGLGLPVVAVVGYTNAGKSSLVAALSKQTGPYVDDRLFATLDPRTRSALLPSGRKILLTDTVGFISDLPVQLVEAFKATLEEVIEADLLLHVVDSSSASSAEEHFSVLQVLTGLGISPLKLPSCSVEAWNKSDLLEKSEVIPTETSEEEQEEEEGQVSLHSGESNRKSIHIVDWVEPSKGGQLSGQLDLSEVPRIVISALTGDGLPELLQIIEEKLEEKGCWSI